MLPLAPPHIMGLQRYIPGRPISEAARFGALDIVKLASNENPLGPSKKAIEAGAKVLGRAHLYPVEDRWSLKEAVCEVFASHHISPSQIVLGNGSSELINMLVRAFVARDEVVLNAWPSFVMYRMATQAHERTEIAVPLTADYRYDLLAMAEIATKNPKVKMVFLANPNNPTGRYISEREFQAFVSVLREDIIVVIDEAYAEYVREPDYLDGMNWVQKRPRTAVLRTFSKIFGLAGLRLGYGIFDSEMAAILHRVRDPFNVNSVVQLAARAALFDREHLDQSASLVAKEGPKLIDALTKLGLSCVPSAANFIMADLSHTRFSGLQICDELLKLGVIVRAVDNYDLPKAIRVTIGKPEENARFLAALANVLSI